MGESAQPGLLLGRDVVVVYRRGPVSMRPRGCGDSLLGASYWCWRCCEGWAGLGSRARANLDVFPATTRAVVTRCSSAAGLKAAGSDLPSAVGLSAGVGMG